MDRSRWVAAVVDRLVESRPADSDEALVLAAERMCRMAGRGWTRADEAQVRRALARVAV
jgi:hypothetical protein